MTQNIRQQVVDILDANDWYDSNDDLSARVLNLALKKNHRFDVAEFINAIFDYLKKKEIE